ncbi:MAG: acyl-CoA dehydrogenase C-terminal domain-containing protein [Endozoicomonas sp. (ex Botrylloides leachii)]|nr:acyl-CoA dehydrogenase C-terminal domain-containing protein [Endozoicomonas sp. (ex Botrylloides leachii)]
MIKYNAPLRDMHFVMYEVFNAEQRWGQWQNNCGVDKETANAVLEESAKLASQVIGPLNHSGDQQSCSIHDNKVSTPKGYKAAYQQYASLGFIGLGGNPEYGGMGMPKVIGAQVDEMISSANLAFTLYPSLTAGVALTLDTHASEQIKAQYLPKLYSGQWSGTMCLTEPHCGTDLGMIRTKASRNEDGSYLITGTKIFITGGEHDLAENIIHLVLAKLPSSAAGTKGISLFLVPKININDHGSLTDRNKVSCSSLEHKMGIKASSTCVMNFDNARGYLIGEANSGLAAMFTMMNYERLFVGIQGLGCSVMSYQTAAAYAKDRLQGYSAMSDAKKQHKTANPIIVHGDVRRMLLNMKALNEAGRAFSTYVAMQLDIVKFSDNPEEKQRAENKVALLTPVAKAFFTDIGLENCITGQQVLGGHGYICEWGQEQLVRDVRITQIYEGTNGIQALDLLARKIAKNGGAYAQDYFAEIRCSVTSMDCMPLAPLLLQALDRLEHLTYSLLTQAKDDPNVISAACVEYLNAFSYVSYAWMWLLMADKARNALERGTVEDAFYQGKINTADYYFKRLLPKVYSLADAADSGADALYALEDEQF